MDFWQQVWHGILEPLRYPFDWTERIFIGYLLSSLIFAIVVYRDLRRRAPESVGLGFFAYLFPKSVYFHPSAVADYKFYLIDRIVFALLLPSTLIYIQPLTVALHDWLNATFGQLETPFFQNTVLVIILVTLLQSLVNDFLLYVMHWLFHKVPTLWEFHKVHHSTEVLTPISAYRMHPVEVILTMNATAIGAAVVGAGVGYFMDAAPMIITLASVNIVQFLFYIFAFNLRHSHVPLGYGPLSYIFVSPWMHQVHHSRETRHIDKNLGFIFGFWDWMFGTLYVPRRGETFAMGLNDGEHTQFHSVSALYFRPFANIARRIANATRAA
jgi:sterol desaturase/sphingolipid hydroxylase (fatty acid hydroxylase superfamily)